MPIDKLDKASREPAHSGLFNQLQETWRSRQGEKHTCNVGCRCGEMPAAGVKSLAHVRGKHGDQRKQIQQERTRPRRGREAPVAGFWATDDRRYNLNRDGDVGSRNIFCHRQVHRREIVLPFGCCVRILDHSHPFISAMLVRTLPSIDTAKQVEGK